MKDDDIYAFGAPAATAPQPSSMPVRAGVRWRLGLWALLATAALVLLLAVAGAWALMAMIGSAGEGLQVTVDGQPWSILHADSAPGLWSVLGLAAGLLALLVVLPVVLMLVLLSVALAVGLALLAVVGALMLAAACLLLVLALVLSPLWGVLLLLWLLLRPRRQAVLASTGATAHA